jgi:rare lipoprotein A
MSVRHTSIRDSIRVRTCARRIASALLFTSLALLALGCHHNTQTAYRQQPPPPVYLPGDVPGNAPARAATTAPPTGFYDSTTAKPVLVETGIASWYGPNYNHRAAADGTTYDQNGLTAAHRTLPLGTTVRVTNLATGQQVLVRITDRGPFDPNRILDLSKGAADAIGGVRAGLIKVRLEAFPHPSADPSGKWAVQTGAFKAEQDALDLKAALIARYKGARVIEFHGPTGYWVRVDPALHDRKQAEAMLDWIGKPDANALPYLVRID